MAKVKGRVKRLDQSLVRREVFYNKKVQKKIHEICIKQGLVHASSKKPNESAYLNFLILRSTGFLDQGQILFK